MDLVQYPLKTQWLFQRHDKTSAQLCMASEKSPNSHFLKVKGMGVTAFSNIALYYKASIIKTVWYWTDQGNRLERTELNPQICGKLVYDKLSKYIKIYKVKHRKYLQPMVLRNQIATTLKNELKTMSHTIHKSKL